MTATDTQTETLPARVESQSPMTLIQLAVENNADPDRLEKLMDLQERWERNQASDAFADAMAAFQAECPAVLKTRAASFGGKDAYSFASLDDIMFAIQSLLTKHGLSIGFSANTQGEMIRVVCKVRKGRHVEESEYTTPIPENMKVNLTQKMGAAMSYAKRYALCAALNITVTDRDNDAGSLAEKCITDEQVNELKKIAGPIPDDRMVAFFDKYGVDIGAWHDLKDSIYQSAKRDLTKVADLVRKAKK